MTIQEAAENSLEQLKGIYDEGEATAITNWLMDSLAGQKRTDRLFSKTTLQDGQMLRLEACLQRLLLHEPIQYVLNETWFCGLKFYVDKHVLIPRPETEELVEWVISNCKFPIDELDMLDIGTGSGCIPITLKRRLGKAKVKGIDISKEALNVARRNGAELGVDVEFGEIDFLLKRRRDELPSFDCIVSNPPYIPENNRTDMQLNVLAFEPALALFVPDNDPLLFYEAIADFGLSHLKKDGAAYMEIHEDLGAASSRLFQSKGYTTEIKKDMQGKERMLKAVI